MEPEYNYDVFISYSRKDYVDENKNILPNNAISAVKDAFDKNGITYWFDEEGIYSGQAFVDIITEAIAVSKTFVFISSKHSNRSKWTKSEILEAFDSDKTIIPFKIDDTEYDKGLKFFLRPLDFIPYFENKDNAIQELIRSVQKVKDEIAEEERKRQAEIRKLEIKAKIQELADDYRRLASQQETILDELVGQSRLLGIGNKQCPICGKSSKIDVLYCDRCGWTFHPFFSIGISEFEDVVCKDHLTLFKANWGSIGKTENMRKEKTRLEDEVQQLKILLEKTKDEHKAKIEEKVKEFEIQLTSQCKIYKENISQLEVERNSLQKQLESFIPEMENLRARLNRKEDLYTELKEKYESVQKRIQELEEDALRQKTQLQDEEFYDVLLISAGIQRLAVIAVVKELTDLGLAEAKDIVDHVPTIISKEVRKEKATELEEQLREAGADVLVRLHETHNQIANIKRTTSFISKGEVFKFVRSYSSMPTSLKSSDELMRVLSLSKLQKDLLNQYGININIRNPKRYTIGDLVTMIWRAAQTKGSGS